MVYLSPACGFFHHLKFYCLNFWRRRIVRRDIQQKSIDVLNFDVDKIEVMLAEKLICLFTFHVAVESTAGILVLPQFL